MLTGCLKKKKKGMHVDFPPTENISVRNFQFSFPRESSFPRRIPGSAQTPVEGYQHSTADLLL